MDFLKVKPEKEEVENGYCIGRDGHSYVTCTQYYENLTVPMLVWWFSFLNRRPKGMPVGKGNLRYKIWCPQDHWDHGLLDPNNPYSGLFVNETLDLGAGTMERIENITLRLQPAQVGISAQMEEEMEAAGYFYIGGNGFGHGLPGGTGVNLIKPVPEGGIKWASIGWGGYHFKDGKAVELIGVKPADYASMRMELAHNITERRHLAKFLPELYEKQAPKPLDED